MSNPLVSLIPKPPVRIRNLNWLTLLIAAFICGTLVWGWMFPAIFPILARPPSYRYSPTRKLLLFDNFDDYYKLESRQGPDGLSYCDTVDNHGNRLSCEITVDNSRIGEADGVVFMSHNKRRIHDFKFPIYKYEGQVWTFFVAESPLHCKNPAFNEPAFHDRFNSTMTYRMDSEFHNVYLLTHRRAEPLSAEQMHLGEVKIVEAFRKKTKLAAIFVSHCDVPSRRDEYLEELSKHMDVDIYGKCGTHTCEDLPKCDAMLARDYLFYLAFENSHCYDYVTEKLYRPLNSGTVVPVVRGGANYTQLFPQNSLVNAADFGSPKALAEYLKQLAKDEDRWTAMFRWRQHWEILNNGIPLCDYCRSFFTPPPSRPRLYHNVYHWWHEGTCFPIQDIP